ncbi:hypothetical protein Val02_34590 [Virgisporangium aliadipatigenens]|uniref:Polysaccharide biosynthesis protein n=1 Tax=Virgisporangium aliadipatigenens TaxID=741659 RepID=A0A8J4DRA4_9ACTN|nr:polysaccharide biosynthesis protein [Virgisporangium aliadipatigenens]GIJ46573.1 hypothetical protein Val02_34590 [Virgisporangium aliadipatigenens]
MTENPPTGNRLVRLAVGAARGAAAPLLVAVAVQSIGNLVFHAVVGRTLDADSYGALGAVLAAMTMLSVPVGALQAAASALVAGRRSALSTTYRALRSVALWTAPAAALVLVGAPAVQQYFHLDALIDAVLLAPYLVTTAVLAAARGLLLGHRKLGTVAGTYLVGTAVRLALGLALAAPFGVTGALVGTVAAEAASLVLAVMGLHPGASRDAPPRVLKLQTVTLAAAAVTGLFLFSSVDLLMARHYLHGDASGQYVATATVAKTVLALPAALMSAVFPRLVAAWPREGRIRALASGAAIVVAPALLGGAVVALAPALLMKILYGNGFPGSGPLVQLLSAVAAVTSMVTVLTYAALARRAGTIAMAWVGSVIEVVLIHARHDTPADIATASVLALGPTLVALAVMEVRAWRRPLPQKAQVPPATADLRR